MKKLSLAAFYLVSLSIFSARAESKDDYYGRFIEELPGKLSKHNNLPSSRQRQSEVVINGKTYLDFGFNHGERKFLYDPTKPGRLALVVMTDAELSLSRRKPSILNAEDFGSYDNWKAANLAAGVKEAPFSSDPTYYDKFDRADGTIEFMGKVYTHRDLGGEGLSKIGQMIEESNNNRRRFGKDGSASIYNTQITDAIGDINRSLNKPNLDREEAIKLAKRKQNLENNLQTRHDEVIAIQNAIREYTNRYRDSGAKAEDELREDEGQRIREQNRRYEINQDTAAAAYEAGRNDDYRFKVKDLKASIDKALNGINEAIHFSYGPSHAALLTHTLSLDILEYPVKNPKKLPVRPGGYIPGVGYTQGALDKYDDSLENRRFRSFLNPNRLVQNFSQLDLASVPIVTLPSGEKMVDISYIHDISEKIRRRKTILQSEQDLMNALLVNFNDPRDFERLFSLVYGYEVRTKFEENLQRSVVEYSKGLSIEMLRLFLMSNINTYGSIFRRSGINSSQEEQYELIENYKKIKSFQYRSFIK